MHYQISLFPFQNFEADFTSDDWETPDDLASSMAALIKTSDRRVLEPAAGSGQIAQYLPPLSFCCEIKSHRVSIGKHKPPQCKWMQQNFLTQEVDSSSLEQLGESTHGYDLIITNREFPVKSDRAPGQFNLFDDPMPAPLATGKQSLLGPAIANSQEV